MTVSVVIPTRNAEKQIAGLLRSLAAQSVRCDVLVIDSSSEDATVARARSSGAHTVIIAKDDFDHGGTRTFGLKQTAGSIIVYLTQDALPADEHAVARLIRPFEDQEVGAAYGRQLPCRDATPFAEHLRYFNYPGDSALRRLGDRKHYGIKTPFLSNSFAAYRRSALEEIGGFREKLILGEDTYAGAKLLLAGYSIAYAADALVYHSHNYAFLEEFKRYFDIGVFHSREKWITEEFGKAEGEGIRYLRSGFAFLTEKRRYFLLPEFFLRNGLKYLGYFAGKHYGKIPLTVVKKISMHGDWWRGSDI